MKLAVLIIFACFAVQCWGQSPVSDPNGVPGPNPIPAKQDSSATLIKRNADGTLLVSLKPQVYLAERGCMIMSDRKGNTLPGMSHFISFSLEKVHYSTIWGISPGKAPPVKLEARKNYKFLIELSGANHDGATQSFSILKIWDEGQQIYEQKKTAQQAAPSNGDKPSN